MQQQEQRTPEPQAIEAEAKILGSVIMAPEIWTQVTRNLRADHFHETKHAVIYRALQMLVESGTHISAVTLTDCLRQEGALQMIGGSTYIMDLLSCVATTEKTQIDKYCKIIADRWLQRSLISFGQDLISSAVGDPHELIRLSVESLSRMNGSMGGGDQRMIQAAIDGRALRDTEIRKPESIVGDGILTESSFVLCYGKPGMGKTWLTLQMALAVASGTPWLGIPTKKRRVGVLELELHQYYLRQRLLALAKNMDPELAEEALANIEFLCRPAYRGVVDIMEPPSRDGLISWIQGHGLGVLVLDAMSRIHFASENNAQEMGRVLAGIERIRDETQAGIWGVHHEPKESKDTNLSDLDAARGSSRFQSDPHTMMRLKLFRGSTVLTFAKMNLGEVPDDLYLKRQENGQFEVIKPPESPADIRERNAMKAENLLLKAGTDGLTTKQAAEEMKLQPRTVKAYLDQVGDRVGRLYYHKSFGKAQLPLSGPPVPPLVENVQESPDHPDHPDQDVAEVLDYPEPDQEEEGAPDDPEPLFGYDD